MSKQGMNGKYICFLNRVEFEFWADHSSLLKDTYTVIAEVGEHISHSLSIHTFFQTSQRIWAGNLPVTSQPHLTLAYLLGRQFPNLKKVNHVQWFVYLSGRQYRYCHEWCKHEPWPLSQPIPSCSSAALSLTDSNSLTNLYPHCFDSHWDKSRQTDRRLAYFPSLLESCLDVGGSCGLVWTQFTCECACVFTYERASSEKQ